MKLNPYILLPLICICGFISLISAQSNAYILNGTAVQDKCNCYTLTNESEYQNGSVWNSTKIDLTNSFDFSFNINLGCRDENGADGMVFVLQPLSTGIGAYGEGMGFAGISPSVGVVIDTYQNPYLNDPWYDNISIKSNGVMAGGHELATPVPVTDTGYNIEDCKWHLLRIVWNASQLKLSAYIDNVLRVETNTDLVKTIFNSDPMVYWGFSAATGVAYNFQRFCTQLNPDFKTAFKNNAACIGNPVIFTDQSQSFAPIKNYYWDLGDGTTYASSTPLPHTYPKEGSYTARLAITGVDGCNSDTVTRIITVGDIPVSKFSVSDTCAGLAPKLSDESTVKIGALIKWQWKLDGTPVSSSQLPQLSNLTAGNHQLQLTVQSSMGCISNDASRNFAIRPIPALDVSANDNCINEPIELKGYQKDDQTTINSWSWYFPDGQTASTQTTKHAFSSAGIKNIILTAKATNGCTSLPVSKSVLVNKITAFAGRDTIIIKDTYFQLNGVISQTGNKPYTIKWTPDAGLENKASLITKGITDNDQVYTLSVTSAEGCIATDAVQVVVFKGSAIYVPTAFTPNHDGKNELLKPYLIGVKQIYNFSVYNRWGQLVFSTSKHEDGWDGTLNGKDQPVDTYVWMLKVQDLIGNVHEKKGTTTLIR